MHIAYEDYALFTVIAKDTRLDDSEGRTITSDDKLTRWDQVTINIQISTTILIRNSIVITVLIFILKP